MTSDESGKALGQLAEIALITIAMLPIVWVVTVFPFPLWLGLAVIFGWGVAALWLIRLGLKKLSELDPNEKH